MRGIAAALARRHREVQREAAAPVRVALDGDAPSVRLDHVLDEGEADATAAPALRLAPAHPVELLEDPGDLRRGNSHPVVLDGQPHLLADAARAHRDPAPLPGVLD